MEYLKYCLVFVLLLVFCSTFVVTENYCVDRKPSNESYGLLKKFCTQESGNLMERRCHINQTIIGLDLSSCSLSKIELHDGRSTIKWLAINNNDINLNKSIKYLRSAYKLTALVIDLHDFCVNFNTSQTENNLTVCETPVSACLHDKCPDNSKCESDGPGLFACPCLKDWQSYKCLKKKNFAYVPWLSSIAAATIVLCIVIRLLQRPDRKRGEEYKKLQEASRDIYSTNEHSRAFYGDE